MTKKIIVLFCFFITFTCIFSATKNFNVNENFYIDIYEMENEPDEHILKNFVETNDNPTSITSNGLKQVFIYPKNNNNFVLITENLDFLSSTINNYTFGKYKNQSDIPIGISGEIHINGEKKCKIFYDETTKKISSNLNPYKVFSYESGSYILKDVDYSSLTITEQNSFKNLLTSYYFINTSAKFFLANGSIIKKDIFVGDVPVNLSGIYGGNYLAAEFLPQDLKCDFFEGDGLDSSEIQGVFVNNSLANINDYFNNTVGFLVNDSRQINILNDTLKADINYSNGGKNVSVNFSRLKKSGGKNVSVYFLLNKSSWEDLSADDIMDLRADFKTNFPLSNEFDFFVVDKDPIIGYHFDELPENINVGFNGTIDGVLIESDAVVYSGSKDFVFNYRGGINNNCDEKLVNSGGKNICINFFVDGINGSNKKYINNGTSNLLVENINLSINLSNGYVANFTTSLYNPESGAYSCLGIIESGELKPCDEGNPQKRIWVGIFKSVSSNLVEVEVIELSNTAIIQFNNTAGDGELNISYCVYEGNVVCSFDEKNKTGANITLSCGGGVDGCIKRILYAVNNSGDLSENETFILPILKLGSVCDNRCVATPFPNILLSSCQGINGCNFFNYGSDDDGAKKCNYQSPNARVFSI